MIKLIPGQSVDHLLYVGRLESSDIKGLEHCIKNDLLEFAGRLGADQVLLESFVLGNRFIAYVDIYRDVDKRKGALYIDLVALSQLSPQLEEVKRLEIELKELTGPYKNHDGEIKKRATKELLRKATISEIDYVNLTHLIPFVPGREADNSLYMYCEAKGIGYKIKRPEQEKKLVEVVPPKIVTGISVEELIERRLKHFIGGMPSGTVMDWIKSHQ